MIEQSMVILLQINEKIKGNILAVNNHKTEKLKVLEKAKEKLENMLYYIKSELIRNLKMNIINDNDVDLESKRSLINMKTETSNSLCINGDCNVTTNEEDDDDEAKETTSINIDVRRRNCTVNIQYLYCDNKLSPIEKSSNPVIILLNMLSRLFNDDLRYKIHQRNVNEEDLMENFIYSLLNKIMSIIRIDRYSAITKFQEELNIITSQWYETYNNPNGENNMNELEWNEIVEISNLNEKWKIIYDWPGEKIEEMIRTIRYPTIPLDEKTNSRGKISNQMKNKVRILENLYKKHLFITRNYNTERKIK